MGEMERNRRKNDMALDRADHGDWRGSGFFSATTHSGDVGMVCRAAPRIVGSTPIVGGG